jgi:hypothetical protein
MRRRVIQSSRANQNAIVPSTIWRRRSSMNFPRRYLIRYALRAPKSEESFPKNVVSIWLSDGPDVPSFSRQSTSAEPFSELADELAYDVPKRSRLRVAHRPAPVRGRVERRPFVDPLLHRTRNF